MREINNLLGDILDPLEEEHNTLHAADGLAEVNSYMVNPPGDAPQWCRAL